MPKRTETAFNERDGRKITVTWDESDPERPAEVKQEDMDPRDRAEQLRKREEQRRPR